MAVGELAVNVTARTERASGNIRRFGKDVGAVKGPIEVVSKSLTRFATGLAGIAAARVTVGALRDIADELDRTAKVADKLDIPAEKLVGLRHAAEQTGVAGDKLDMSLQRMVRRISEAAKGTGEAVGALEELGLNAEELNRLSPERQFAEIADAMKGVGNQGDRVRLSMKLFDSEGVDLVNTLKLGSRGLREMQVDAERLGIAISGDRLKDVEEFNSSMDRLSKLVGGFGREIIIDIAPEAKAFVEYVIEVKRGFGLFSGEEAQKKLDRVVPRGAQDVAISAVGMLRQMLLEEYRELFPGRTAGAGSAEYARVLQAGGTVFGDSGGGQGQAQTELLQEAVESLGEIVLNTKAQPVAIPQ